jgi:hypothetical protein
MFTEYLHAPPRTVDGSWLRVSTYEVDEKEVLMELLHMHARFAV